MRQPKALIRFNSFRFLGAKLKQCHLSITIQMVSAEGYNSGRPGIDIRFTEFFNSRTIYRLFTLTRRGPLFDLQGFHSVKLGPFLRFTGFLQSQARPPFSILQGVYSVKPGPLFRFTGFLQSQARPPFSIYRVFTESSQAPFFDLQSFYRVKRALLFSDCKHFFTCYLHNLARNIYRFFTKKML